MTEGRRIIVPSFDYRIDFSAASERGQDRAENEDAVLCRPQLGLFGIADGMGGHAAGEIAASVSLAAVERTLSAPGARRVLDAYAADPGLEHRRAVFVLLVEAMKAANDAVLGASEKEAAKRGMGCTLDFAVMVRDRAFFAHVGDSRAYLVRPTATLQLTHDHAAYDSLRTSGKRSPMRGGSRGPLNNSIGHKKELLVDTLSVDLSAGDRILLCTDGAYSVFDDEHILAKSCRAGPAPEVCQALVDRVKQQGAADDASVVLICVGERFAQRSGDAGPRSRDLVTLSSSPLFMDLSVAAVLGAMAAGVEVELDKDAEVPRAVANDRVAYVILEGLVELPSGRTLGPSGFLMAESLLDVASRGKLPKVLERSRLLRIRHDDFCEVCAHNTHLAVELYKRIARHLAQTS